MTVPIRFINTYLLFILGAGFLILLGSSVGAAAECDPCFDVASGVMAFDSDGYGDDVIFWAHFGEDGISNVTIKVYHDGGTLYGEQTTDAEEGNAFFANLTQGSYYWEAYDLQDQQLMQVGGYFDIITGSTLVFYAVIFDLDEEFNPNDLVAAANDTTGANASLWVEIDDASGRSLYSGAMIPNDGDWDDEMSHYFMQPNLTAGAYSYTLWSDEDHGTFYQNGTFAICHLANCLNIDVNVMQWFDDADGLTNDVIIIPRFGEETLNGITIDLYDEEMSWVANGTSDESPVFFFNLTDGGYYWNASVQDEMEIWEGTWFQVNSDQGYEHGAFLVPIEENGNDTWYDDFVAFLNVSGESSTEAYIEVFNTTMDLVDDGNPYFEHEETIYYVASNLSFGRYYFNLWLNNTKQELIQNGTFVVCPPYEMDEKGGHGGGIWFSWWNMYQEEWEDDGQWYATLGVEGYLETDNDEASGWLGFEIYDGNMSYMDSDSLNFTVYDDDDFYFNWNWTMSSHSERIEGWYYLNLSINMDDNVVQNQWLNYCFGDNCYFSPVWFEWKNHWTEDTDDDQYEDTIFFNGTIGTDREEWIEVYLNFTVYGPDELNENFSYIYSVNNTNWQYFEWNFTINENGSHYIEVRMENETEFFHYQSHDFCFGDGCYQGSVVWFDWKNYWTEDTDKDGYDDTIFFNGTIATYNEEWVEGYLNFTIYGPDNLTEYNSSMFYVNSTNWQYFEWEYTILENGSYWVEVQMENETEFFHYQDHDFCLGDECGPELWFDWKQHWVEDTDEDDITDTWYIEGNISTKSEEGLEGWYELYIYDENRTQLFDYSESFNITNEDGYYLNVDWSNETGWYTVEISLWINGGNEAVHTQWHEFEFSEKVPFWFEWKDDWTEDQDDDGTHDTWYIAGEIYTDSNESVEGWYELYIYNESETQLFDYSESFNITDDRSHYFQVNWTGDPGWYEAEISLWYDDGEQEQIHLQWHYFMFKEQQMIYFDWKEEYQDEEKDGDNWTGLLGIYGEIATRFNETQTGYIEFQVFNETWDWLETNTNAYEVDENNSQYFDWNWTTNETGWYYIEVRIYNGTGEEKHYQEHNYCLGDGCYNPPAWFEWEDVWYEENEGDFIFYAEGEVATDSDKMLSGHVRITIYGPDDMRDSDTYDFEIDQNSTYYFEWDWNTDEAAHYQIELSLWDEDDDEQWGSRWYNFDLEDGKFCFMCFNIANGVFAEDDDEVADDVVFVAHFGNDDDGLHASETLIEVYYVSNETLAFSGYTDLDDGEIWFYNVTADDYYWQASDIDGVLIGSEGGDFIIEDDFELEYFGYLGNMDEDCNPNDFMAGSSDFSGQNRTLYVEIVINGTGELVTEGNMSTNYGGRGDGEDPDEGGDGPDTQHMFQANNLTIGLYKYTIWMDDSKATYVQIGYFEVCNPYTCINLDFWIGDYDEGGEPDDAMLVDFWENQLFLEGITVYLYDSSDQEVSNMSVEDDYLMFFNLTDDMYHWTSYAPDGTMLDEWGYFIIDTANDYDHASLLADTEDHPGKGRLMNDFGYSLNNTDGPVTDAYVELFDVNGTLVTSGSPNEEHDERQWFVYHNLSDGRYTFQAWLDDTKDTLIHNGTFIVCLPPKLLAWFGDWNYTDIDRDQDDYNETKYVQFEILTGYTDEVTMIIEVRVSDSTGLIMMEEAQLNVTGYDDITYEWDAQYSDYYSFEFSLYDLNGMLLGNFTILDNWLEINETGDPPTAVIEDILPSPADEGDTVTFEGSGTDDGTIELYHWSSDIDGELYDGSSTTFTTSSLSIGVHNITLRVKDNDGLWSQAVTLSLEIVVVPNEAPDASIDNISPNPAKEGLIVTFAGSGTDDGTIDGYLWTIDGWLASELTTFSLGNLTEGTYAVTFAVVDDEGEWSTTETTDLVILAPTANQPPEATIDDIDPNPANEGATMTFQGSGEDEEGTIVAYEWKIDGVVVNTNATFTRSDLNVGSHEVSFRVKDDDGDWSDWETATLTIQDSTPPSIGLLVEPNFDTGELMIYVRSDEDLFELNVTLDNGSARAEIIIVMVPDGPGDKRNFTGSHSSVDAGDYVVTANANDGSGNPGTTTTTASIEAVETVAGTPTVVDNTDTTDTKLEIVTNSGASGSVSVSKTTAPAPLSQTDNEAGIQELGIYVSIDIDDAILADLDYVNITVYYDEAEIPADVQEAGLTLFHYIESSDEWVEADPTGVNMVDNYVWGRVSSFSIFAIFGSNVAPTADAGSALTGQVNQEVTFHGSGSDLDGDIVLYEWDFDGDGTYDWNSVTEGLATHTYDREGTFTARLRVTDDLGATGFDSVTVTIGKKKEDEGGFIPGFPALAAIGVLALAGLAYRRRS